MTKLSDADRKIAAKLLEALYGDSSPLSRRQNEYIVANNSANASAMLTETRRLITAEILAGAGMDEAQIVEAMARAVCSRNGTSQCAAICLTRFATDNRQGRCFDAIRVHGENARVALAAIQPHIARLAAENAALKEEIEIWKSVFPDIAPENVLPDRAKLEAENARMREALEHSAAIVHDGGLAGLSKMDALNNVRNLLLPYWNKTNTEKKRADRVRAALGEKP